MQHREPHSDRREDRNDSERSRKQERSESDTSRDRDQSREFEGGSRENPDPSRRHLTERERRERWPIG